MGDVKTIYDSLKQKYSLPDFKDIDREFVISDLENDTYLLCRVRDRMNEKLDSYLKILEQVLQPDTNLTSIYEYKNFEDPDRNEVYQVFKKLMKISRHCAEIALNNHEDEAAEFIKSVFKDWPELSKKLKRILSVLKDAWDMETNIKEDLSYLG